MDNKLTAEDFQKEYFGVMIPTHNQTACNALKEYERLAEQRDCAMFEQIQTPHGTINGRRLNTFNLPRVSIWEIAKQFETSVEEMKLHWNCINSERFKHKVS